LAQGTDLTPAEVFWVVKLGLKFSGMPPWGRSHSDDEIWDLAAFVLRLSHVTPTEYRNLVTHAPRDKDILMMPMPGRDAMD
jgi:mono/diheme cytochrome c family protein